MINLHESTGIDLATPGSAVRHASVARHVTDCATRPGKERSRNGITFKFLPFIYLTFVLGAQKNRLDKLNEIGCFSCFGCSKEPSHSDDYF